MAEPTSSTEQDPSQPETAREQGEAVSAPDPAPGPSPAVTGRSRANPQARSRPRASAASTAGQVTGDALASTEAVGTVETTLYERRSGAAYPVRSPAERTRLLRSGYSDRRPYLPEEHNVDEVVKYLRENPSEAAGIIARERQGQARKGIIEAPSGG